MTANSTTHRLLQRIWTALDGDAALLDRLSFTGEHSYPSVFAVDDLAAAAVGAAALAGAEYLGASADPVIVDRRLASLWFGASFRPEGWTAPPTWDPIAGDYQATDGWIRLHTNAPHHLAAALKVLGVPADRAAVTAAVRGWRADELEAAIVAARGAAATMRSREAWAEHPQGSAVAEEPLVWCERLPATDSGTVVLDPARPLSGLRVLDLTRVLAGPVCTRFLAGLGATVLRIDPPNWEEPAVVPDTTLGKSCARLDARTPGGRAQLLELFASADVFVHGYRPGALDSIGLGAAERACSRPGLVDVSLDAYGWTGPWAGRRGFDSLVQMSSGIAHEGMRRFGTAAPKPLPVQALDHAAGYIMAAAVLRGLAERRSGHGWRARTSLAGVAALLSTTVGEGNLHAEPLKPGSEDYASELETTVWGKMQRLRSPVSIGGVSLRWNRPASPLGSAPARW